MIVAAEIILGDAPSADVESAANGGYDVEKLLDHGVRRTAYARLDHTQYLIRSWRGRARLHIALAARSGPAL